MIRFITGTALGRNLAALAVALLALLAMAGALMRAGSQREKTKTLKREIKAHEVRNEVDLFVERTPDPKLLLRAEWMRRVETDLP